jgi:hypothetical protein
MYSPLNLNTMKNKIHPLVTIILFFGFLLLLTLPSSGQQKGKSDNSPQPQWVKMMDDPNVNFHEAKRTFEAFWSNKEKPTEEKEIFGNFEKKKEARVATKEGDAEKYTFEYKKFLNWQREVAPYVQANGRILNTEERIQLWQQEKKNRDDAEAKAKKDNDN